MQTLDIWKHWSDHKRSRNNYFHAQADKARGKLILSKLRGRAELSAAMFRASSIAFTRIKGGP